MIWWRSVGELKWCSAVDVQQELNRGGELMLLQVYAPSDVTEAPPIQNQQLALQKTI